MFVLEEFVKQPEVTALSSLTKAQWLQLASHYGLSVRTGQRKDEVRSLVINQLVKAEVFTAEEVAVLGHPQDLLALKQLEVENRRLELELLKAENERLRLRQDSLQPAVAQGPVFKLGTAQRFVPTFSEKEPEEFFNHFERTAALHSWPKDKWVLLAQSSFVGRGQKVYTSLDNAIAFDYDQVKRAVLKAYRKVPEAYRQQFRRYQKNSNETYVEFFRQKELLCQRWVESSLDSCSYEKLLELIVMEEAKSCLPPKVRAHLDERELRTLAEAGPAADHFSLTSIDSFRRNQPWDQSSPSLHVSSTSKGDSAAVGECAGREAGAIANPVEKRTGVCSYCKIPGHHINFCRKRPRRSRSSSHGRTALHASALCTPEVGSDSQVSDVLVSGPCQPCSSLIEVSPSFRSFCSEGRVGRNDSCQHTASVIILRDTGSDLSFILKKDVPSFDCYTGESIIVAGIPGIARYPLCSVYLECGFITGQVTLAVVDSLRVANVSIVIGYDLAGDQVTPSPIVSAVPTLDNNTLELEQNHPKLFPVCAVTRSMSKALAEAPVTENTNFVSDLDHPKDGCDPLTGEYTLADFFDGNTAASLPSSSRPELLTFGSTPVTREKLIFEQSRDPELEVFFDHHLEGTDVDKASNCFYLQSGVLMRKFRPLHVPSSHTWETVHQIVVPKPLRQDIVRIAHDGAGGHLGVNKTYQKILSHFYWPKLKRGVSSYIRTCPVCQATGKPGTGIKPAPLKPIPVIEEPFSKVIIDCVGPLPKSKRGHQYLLTIMDVSTRYPEAIPLRSINTRNVVRALIKFFTQVGLPAVVQSDQGSNFTSGMFEQVMRTLGVQQVRSSVFHPQSQGALERFHHTLKTMLKAFCLETGEDWDEGIDLLLFSVRDSVQESLGFTPFQLIYGHEVRGPLKVLKESWLWEENTTPVAAYVEKFHGNLQSALRLAHLHLGKAQQRMKDHFDKSQNAKMRTFQVGDQVLALLPLPKHPLQSKYYGPYRVLDRVNEVNYVIGTPERRKKKRLVHVNLLKRFFSRDQSEQEGVERVVLFNTKEAEEECESDPSPFVGSKLCNSDVLSNLDSKLKHLSPTQASDVMHLLQDNQGLFGDVPRLCPLLPHDVDVQGAAPIRQAPYRLSAQKKDFLRKEVERLQQQGLIRPSLSPWASPVVLVPKAGGSFRLCVDYRKVNKVTRPDAFPLPRMDDIIDDVGSARYVTKLDLLQGYYQVPLTERAQPISAFVTPFGLWEFVVLPFGMRNAPATFQRLMNHLTTNLPGVRVYLDDLIVWSDTWEDHIARLRNLFSTLASANLTVNLSKSEFSHAHVTFLGHVVGQGKLAPITAKVEVIKNYPVPTNKKELMRFMGMAGYYRRFCRNFAQVSAPLTDLLSSNRTFVWMEQCQKAFDNLKNLLASAPVLQVPDPQKPFFIHVDASETGVGAVLMQKDSEALHPVCYYSQKFKGYQKSYATVEKEALGIVLALEKFEVFLAGSAFVITVFTDHSPLVFIEKVKFKNTRVLRWALALQPYHLEVKHIRGKDNFIADALSRV